MTSTTLYHYTCDHGAVDIDRDRLLRPNTHPLLPEPLIWLTDLDIPFRAALGLTSLIQGCDRTAHRYTVHADRAVWWPHYSRRIERGIRRRFDFAAGAMPAHWWVATHELRITTTEKKEAPRR